MSLLEQTVNQPLHILYVDDDYEDFLLTEAMLQSHSRTDYKVDWVDSFEKGIGEAQGRQSGRLSGRLQPGSHGIEFVQWAKEAGFEGPMILLTGRNDSDLDQRALAAGAVDYLERTPSTRTFWHVQSVMPYIGSTSNASFRPLRAVTT